MSDTFIEKISVLDEWSISDEDFRLVDKGAGPNELQVMRNGVWKSEKSFYTHSVLTHRIKELSLRNHQLADFAIWMTGCGYDFCQHKYFCEQRDKLLNDHAPTGDSANE